ncbi:MAG: hypothetical protein AAF202_11305 [Pseudomonadota bacterium]
MTHFNSLFCILFLSAFVSGCAVAPFMTPKSGQSLGKGNWQVDASVLPVPGAMVSAGITENLDAGAIYEVQFGSVISAFGKYSFVNNKTGWATSLYAGAFTGASVGTTNGYYVGPVISYKTKSVEPYLSVRYSYVRWDLDGATDDEVDDSILELDTLDTEITFGYIQTDFGVSFWVNKGFGINVHGKLWTVFDDKVEVSSSVMPGVSFLFNF